MALPPPKGAPSAASVPVRHIRALVVSAVNKFRMGQRSVSGFPSVVSVIPHALRNILLGRCQETLPSPVFYNLTPYVCDTYGVWL